jgi:Uncharacterized ACR, COG1430
LQPDSDVWVVPANAVHTIGMLFSFNLVLIDKDFKVVGLRELVRPFRITWPERHAESVLELPAHTIFRSRTKIGDQLLIERYEAKKPLNKPNGEASDSEPIPVGVGAAGPQVVPIPPQASRVNSSRSRFADTNTR